MFLVSEHYLHALEAGTGLRASQYVGGPLDGRRRPDLRLPFTPTGGAAGQHDTFYMPSLGSADSNKNIDAFSLVTGARGWGYRASGDILTSPVVGGAAGDPKLYFVTNTGLVTCLDATNYRQQPRGVRTQPLPVDHARRARQRA